ncbi:MAG: hypothetical protein AB8B69_13265 [Chitinophagales bacterium]
MKKIVCLISILPWLSILFGFITISLRIYELGYYPDMSSSEYGNSTMRWVL